VLFAASYLIYLSHPRLGPANFPLWGLLLTLGFVAGIGSVASWFFATDEAEPAPSSPAEAVAEDASPARSSRNDFGRPIPDLAPRTGADGPSSGVGRAVVAGGTAAEPWDEDSLPPAATHGPRPVLTTPDDPGEIGRALEEIEEIQRQLATRPSPSPVRREAPARA